MVLFEVSGWSDAQRHATRFNGSPYYDHCYCYFNEPGANYRTDRGHFWSLP
ncbi:type VI secretion system amidase effector protein Tae4 [Ralstonia solanacearum]|uniref:type VI secretion system amidase effector protein Tae4 n=1 Tax=Ralstonia solanacearum TaxID=305 RepID=UPI0004B0BD9C|nr:type VI secretion system amidase effector protein Tae4 [Ralstonia solanacearum]MCL9843565.1 type VI secretion system amidase effector protein Tae4 [Ralstonia solanacearum]MCL9847873.1 type VI secretion system amidase effector protein Tae4 [Ralstonia solanacearum]MCL9852346.1 type VI secretion system amidase effector protein Tae4 [Ralstonia solanacearum]MCL9857477.1 type VI secretion system amidase effector protein Tae4 [Ralstonia solanacearum]MCL9862491.1 type VI secretion system amidase ef